jgi:hypothetical protein
VREFFINSILPVLIVGTLMGSAAYLICARCLYDYILENYHDILSERNVMVYGDFEDGMGGYIASIGYAARSGNWRRIESKRWRIFFIATQITGLFALLCCAMICVFFIL